MTPLAEPATVVLPSVIDLKAVTPLHQEVLALRGRALTIDASEVTRLGALGLQVLLSADATWKLDGNPFSIVKASDEFSGALQLFGASALNAADAEELRP